MRANKIWPTRTMSVKEFIKNHGSKCYQSLPKNMLLHDGHRKRIWLLRFEAEYFPTSRHNDMVDAFAYCMSNINFKTEKNHE